VLIAEVEKKKLHLANMDFDTGRSTKAGEYGLTDNAYARLLDQLAQKNFTSVSPALRDNILSFYQDPNASIATKRNSSAWSKTQEE
jgi:hypothetical protein